MEIIYRLDRDIKAPLGHLSASVDRLQALRGRFLLDLVDYLEKCPGPRVRAHIRFGELSLFLGILTVRVAVDWYDYGPLREGLPVAHYRVWAKCPAAVLTREWRTSDVEQAGRHILQALNEE